MKLRRAQARKKSSLGQQKKNSSCMKSLKPTNPEESGSGRLETDITKITLDIPRQDCFGSDNSKTFSIENGWRKVPEWECLCLNRQQGLFLSECMDDIKIAGKKSNLETQMERLMKHADLEEQGDAPPITENCRHRNAPPSVFVYLYPVGQDFGSKFKNLWFLLKGLRTDNHWKDFRDTIGCRHVALQLIGSTKNRFT